MVPPTAIAFDPRAQGVAPWDGSKAVSDSGRRLGVFLGNDRKRPCVSLFDGGRGGCVIKNSPNSPKAGVGFSGFVWNKDKGGLSSPHPAAASPRRVTTSLAFGRSSRAFQQSLVKVHSESENPMAEEFPGFLGCSPRSTLSAASIS